MPVSSGATLRLPASQSLSPDSRFYTVCRISGRQRACVRSPFALVFAFSACSSLPLADHSAARGGFLSVFVARAGWSGLGYGFVPGTVAGRFTPLLCFAVRSDDRKLHRDFITAVLGLMLIGVASIWANDPSHATPVAVAGALLVPALAAYGVGCAVRPAEGAVGA